MAVLDPAGPKASGSGWGRQLFSGPPLLGNLVTQWSGRRPGSRPVSTGKPCGEPVSYEVLLCLGRASASSLSLPPSALPSFHMLGQARLVPVQSRRRQQTPHGPMKLPISHLEALTLQNPGVPEMLPLTTGGTARTEASWSFVRKARDFGKSG